MVWSFRTVVGAALCIGVITLTPLSTSASPADQELVAQIEDFFSAEPAQTVLNDVESERLPSIDFARAIHQSVANNDREILKDSIDGIARWAADEPSVQSALLQTLALGIAEHYPDDVFSSSKDGLVDYLKTFDADDDWYIQARVDLMISSLYLPIRNDLTSMQYAQRAIAAVPDGISPWATDIKMGAAEASVSFYGIRGDARGMLKAAQNHSELARHYDGPIDRHEFLTNLTYALNANHDFETADHIAVLFDTVSPSASFPVGLDKIYRGRTKLELGEYQKAAELLNEARKSTDSDVIRRHAKTWLASAYAGLGEQGEALQLLRELDQEGVFDSGSPLAQAAILQTQALLAVDSRDADRAFELMKQRLDLLVGEAKNSKSSELTSLLANLENTRGRQIERADALRREAELKAVQLEQQRTINRALLALLAALGAAIIALFFFLRYREKTNAQVQALQVQALSAEKMKTEFLGLINHELRTPLNAVIGISDAMIHHNSDTAIQAQAQAIQDSGEQLFDLLESLIDMSTIEADKMSLAPDETDLGAMLREEAGRWNRRADEKSLDYTHFIAPELDRLVIADVARIRQCAKFMLANAMRFTHSGRVHMHATGFTAPDGQLDFCLIVADTGQGISEAVQTELFKPFIQADATMTRKYGGAGLSLSIARKLARMMDGDVSVKSVEGRGSEFTFTARLGLPAEVEATSEVDGVGEASALSSTPQTAPTSDASEGLAEQPAAPAIAETNPAPTDAPAAAAAELTQAQTQDLTPPVPLALSDATPGSYEAELIDLMVAAPQFEDVIETLPPRATRQRDGLNGMSVLVVEDLPSNQDVIKLLLEPAGVDCIEAMSGAEALRILAARTVDAVVMDIRMPGMNGLETTRHIRDLPGLNGKLPIIVLSADAAGTASNDALAAGADAFLSKPVMRTQLISALNRALDARQDTSPDTPISAAG